MIKELCHDEAILSQRCEVATVEDESVAQDLIDTIKSLDDAGCLDVGAVHHERLVGAELLGDVTDGLAAANTMNDFCNEKLKIVLHNKYLHNY